MALFSDDLLAAAEALLDGCRGAGRRIATAESCTGGLISGLLTEIPGSSDVVGRAFITYSNEAKRELLGVDAGTLEAHGAVSRETALEMAAGALARSGPDADISVAVTGVAGPGGGSPDKPVGTVWFAAVGDGGPEIAEMRRFPGDRGAVRLATVAHALVLLGTVLRGKES